MKLEDLIRKIVREELATVHKPKKKRWRRCGTGDRMPQCWGSTIYGPDGCYCGGRGDA